MADTPLVGQGYSDYVGTRASSADPTTTEFFNKQTNQGYANAGDLATAIQPYNSGANAGNVFDILKQGYTPVKTDISQNVAAKTLENPTSPSDVNALLQQNQSIANQYALSYLPSDAEKAAQTNVNQSTATLRNFDTSVEGGIQNIMKKPVALEFQQGQEAALTRDAGFTRSSLANEVSAYTDTLGSLQQNRQALTQSLQAQMQNGQFNVNTAIQLQQIQRQQQQEALKFRMDNGVTSPYFNYGGTIYDANNNPIGTPQEFFAKTGVQSFDQARQGGLLTDINPQSQYQRQANSQLMTQYPDAAININDDQATAQAKLQNSAIYRKNIAPTYQATYDPNTGNPTAFNPQTGQYVNTNSASGNIIIPPNTLAGKNNNPGNLRYVGQAGATQGQGGFAAFATPEAGYQALISQIQLDAGRGETLGQFINKYAPPSENNTSQYLSQAISALGGSSSTKLSSLDVGKVAAFMAKKESGTVVQASSPSTGIQPRGAQSGSDSNSSGSSIFPANTLGNAANAIVNEQATLSQFSNRVINGVSQQSLIRNMILNKIPNFNFNNSEINYTNNKTAQTKNASMLGSIQNAQKTALAHISDLTASMNKIGNKLTDVSLFGLGNLYNKNIYQANSNNPDFKSFESNLGLVREELAKVLGGGQATDASRADAAKTLPDYLGQKSFNSVINTVTTLMAQKIKEYSQSVSSPRLDTGYDPLNGGNSSSTSNNDPLGLFK